MRTKTWKLIPTIKRLHYIDIKFPILRSNVFIPTIKHFRFYMENILLKNGLALLQHKITSKYSLFYVSSL